MVAERKDGFPAGYGICAHNGMDGLEVLADIPRSSACFGVNFKPVSAGGFVEAGLGVCCGKTFEEFLVWS